MKSGTRFLLIAALASCAPPTDELASGEDFATRDRNASGDARDSRDPARDASQDERRPASSGAPLAPPPAGGAHPESVVYQTLAGGRTVIRCAGCGEVQRPGATECPACRAPVRLFSAELACTACDATGHCARCGDDRSCLACDGGGVCASCAGGGVVEGVPCPDCATSKKCGSCAGDGWRETVKGDFRDGETWWQGTCATCFEGSGVCIACGSSGKDADGALCLLCGGAGACGDCGGDGRCGGCGGAGACVDCSGSGRIVLDGASPKPSSRIVTLRTAAGSAVQGRIQERRGDVLALTRADGSAPFELRKEQLHGASWYFAVKALGPVTVSAVATPDERATHLMELGHIASAAGLWFPAIEEYRRAGDADLRRKPDSLERMRDAENGRAAAWGALADAAGRKSRFAEQRSLLETIAFRARGTAAAERANVQIMALRAKNTGASPEDARDVATALLRTKVRIERAKLLTARADAIDPADPSRDRWYERAAAAAGVARRIAGIAAQRTPASRSPWKIEPQVLLADARLAEAEALTARAAFAVAGGRFQLGERAARRALSRDPSSAKAQRILDDALSGLLRAGILTGSPPPSRR